MSRKLLTAVLIIALVFSAALSASADSAGMTLKVGTVSSLLLSGEEIRVPVTAVQNAGYVSATFTLLWESEALELCAIEFTDLAPNQGTPQPQNSGAFTLRVGQSARRENFTGTGTLFTAVFRVTQTAEPGDYPVELMNTVVLDTDLHYLEVNVVQGTVSLLDEPAPTQPERSAAPDAAPATAPAAQNPADPTVSGENTQPQEISAPAESTDAPVVLADETAAPTQAKREEAASVIEETDEDASGSTVPWLTIAASVTALCAAAFVVIKRKKNG